MAAGLKTIKIAFLGDSKGLIAAAAAGGASMNKFALGLAAGAVASGAKMVKMAADFQSATNILTTSAGETQAGLEVVRKGILNLAGQVGDSANELAAAMVVIERGGQHGADGLKVLQAAAEGAKAENADLTVVADAVTSVLQDYHLTANDAALVTSQMVAAVGAGKTTFEQFTGSLSSVLPIASAAGISFEDISAAIASMTVHGVSAEQATDNLADVIRHMVSPTQLQTKELAQLGVNSQDLAAMLGTKGLTGTLQFLSQTILKQMGPSGQVLLATFNESTAAAQSVQTMLGALPPKLKTLAQGFLDGSITLQDWRMDLRALPADQAALLTQFQTMAARANGFSDALKSGSGSAQTYEAALAKVTGDATGLNVALQLTGENTAYVQNAVKKVSDATTEAGNHVEGWASIQATFNQRAAQTKDELGAVSIRIGTALLPYAQKAIEAIGSLTDWFSRNTGWAKALGIAIGVLAGAFITYRAAVVATKVATTAWNVVQGIQVGLTAASRAELAGSAAAMLVYAARMAVVKAATVTWTAVQWLLDAALNANPIGLIVLGIIALVAAIILVIKYHKQIATFFVFVWGKIWAFLKIVGAWFAGPFADVFKSIGAVIAAPFLWLWHVVLEPAFKAIALIFTTWWRIVSSIFALWFFVVRTVVGGVILWLWHTVYEPAFQAIAAVVAWAWDSVIQPTFAALVTAVQAVGAAALWLWTNGFQPAINAIVTAALWLWTNGISPAFNAIAAAADWLWGVIKTAFDKITSIFHTVYDTAKSVFKSIADVISGAFSAAAGGIKSALNVVIDQINKGVNVVNGFIDKANKVPGVDFPHVPNIPRLETGGVAVAGRSYLVGERGPELFTPGVTGRVTPNGALGGPTVIENHIEIGGEVVRVVRTEIDSSQRQTRRLVLAGATT